MPNGAGKGWKFTQHPIVEALVERPRNLPRLTLFAGLPGDGPTQGRKRVYVSPVLDEYLEVDADDLLYTHEWPGDIRHLVWIKEGARVTHISTREHDAAQQFLTGPITTAYYADATAGAPAAPQPAPAYPPAYPPPPYPPPFGWTGRPGDYGDWTASNCRTCPSKSP